MSLTEAIFDVIVKRAVEEVRNLANKASLDELKKWMEICVKRSTEDRNYPRVLQDIVNVLGMHLGFNVKFGEFAKGPDGIWSIDKSKIVVEVKSSSYHFQPSELDGFIKSTGAVSGIAIAPEFSPDKIAAVKGGYQNIRLLTMDGLYKLAKLKEEYEIPTEKLLNILIPQENFQLDGLISLIAGIIEARREVEEKPVEKDVYDIDDVPRSLKNLGDVTKAMYIVLSKNPEKEFDSSELAKEIMEKFPKTFAGRNFASISYGTIWAGNALEEKGLIEIIRYKPNPERYPDWIKRKYKIKLKA